MRGFKALFIFGVFCAMFSSSVHAQDMTMRYSPHTMQGLRPLGMGNAFTAVKGSDINTLFYNPAGLADYDNKLRMDFLTVEGQISSGVIDFVGDILDLTDDIDAAGDDDAEIQVLDNFVDNNTNNFHEVGINLHVANFRRRFGKLGVAASLFAENRTALEVEDTPENAVDFEVLSQVGLQVGLAHSFADDLFELGMAIKFIERHLIDDKIAESDLSTADSVSDFVETDNYGFGVGVDLGLKTRLPFDAKIVEILDPVIAITYQDVANTRFTGDVGNIPQSLSAGFSLNPSFTDKIRSTFAFDVRDINRDTSFITKMYAGYELLFDDISPILRSVGARIGMAQGYFTAGLGVDVRFIKLEAATWGREIGLTSRQGQNRMWGVQFSGAF